MKVFTFKYERFPKKSTIELMKRAIRTGKPDICDNEIICGSMSEMLHLMPKARFDVFAAIVEYKPESIYALAQTLKKDQANVLRDAKALASLGLVKLVFGKNGERERLRPVALYDKIVLEFEPKKAVNSGSI